jgi:hypothetical protein
MTFVIRFSTLSFNLSFEPFSSLYFSLFKLVTPMVTHSSHIILFPLLVILILTINDSHFMIITNSFYDLLRKLVAMVHDSNNTETILTYRGRLTTQAAQWAPHTRTGSRPTCCDSSHHPTLLATLPPCAP